METLIYLIVIFLLYSIVQVVKALMSKNTDVKGTPYLGEAFPSIDTMNEQPHRPDFFESVVSDNTVRRESPKVVGRNDIKAQQRGDVHEKNVQDDVPSCKKERLVSLRSRSAAKRAFIETEVLNRKY